MSNNLKEHKLGPIFLLVLSGVLWGTSFPAISFGLQYSSPEAFLLMRFLFAAIISTLLFPKAAKKALKRKELVFIGSLNGIAYLFQFIGQQWVPAGQSALLVNSYSVLVPFIAYFMVKEKITYQKIFGAIIGLIGVVLITNEGGEGIVQAETKTEYYLGVLLVFGAGFVWAFYVVYTKLLETGQKKEQSKNDEEFSAEDILVASMYYTVIIAFMSLIFTGQNIFSSINIISISVAIYLAVFCSILPLIMYLHSLKKVDAGLSTIILLIEVVVSFLISTLFLGENIVLKQIIGGVLVITGVLIAMRETSKQLEQEQDS